MMNEQAGRHPRELLSPYLDGELAADESAGVALHLEKCDGCRALLEDLRVLASAVAAEAPPSPPADLAARIARRVGELPRKADVIPIRRPVWRSPLMFGSLAAALAGIIVTVVWLYGRQPAVHRETTVAQLESEPARAAERDRAASTSTKEPAASAKIAPADQDARIAEEEGRSSLAAPKRKIARDAPAVREPIPPPEGEPETTALLGSNAAGALRPEPAPAAPPPAVAVPAPAEQPTIAPSPPESREDIAGKLVGDDAIAMREIAAYETAPGSVASAGAGGVGGAVDSRRARSIELVSGDYQAVLNDDGALTFRAGAYECEVPRFTLSGLAELSRREDSVAEVGEIFELASAQRQQRAAAMNEAKGEAPDELLTARQVPAGILLFRDADASVLYREPLTASEETGKESSPASIAARIDRLIREHYLPIMESACGTPPPLPRTGGEEPSE